MADPDISQSVIEAAVNAFPTLSQSAIEAAFELPPRVSQSTLEAAFQSVRVSQSVLEVVMYKQTTGWKMGVISFA